MEPVLLRKDNPTRTQKILVVGTILLAAFGLDRALEQLKDSRDRFETSLKQLEKDLDRISAETERKMAAENEKFSDELRKMAEEFSLENQKRIRDLEQRSNARSEEIYLKFKDVDERLKKLGYDPEEHRKKTKEKQPATPQLNRGPDLHQHPAIYT